MEDEGVKEYYYQVKNIEYLRHFYGKELWVQVSGRRELNGADATFWAALIPTKSINEVYGSSSWDSSIGTQAPYFLEYGGGVKYIKAPFDEELCENIVHYRDFYGIRPNYVEIGEEFRFLNNLIFDSQSNCYLEIAENGECIEVAKIENRTCVYIKLKYLIRYATAKQMALLLFFDIRTKLSGSLAENNLEKMSKQVKESDIFFDLWGDEMCLSTPTVYSVLMGKRIIKPLPIEECGYWPYERKREYIDFIIGIDNYGEPKQYTCNPNMLANNFGANPDAPHYLTPVFFRKEVLQKYFAHPEVYSVEDGTLRCKALWSLEIDNHHKDCVSVYLGDLGRDLPELEQSYWKQYNIATDEKLSSTSFKRDFLCVPTSPEISDLKFKSKFERFQEMWSKKFQWDLFLPLSVDDEYNFNGLHLPITKSQEEFDHLVLSLVKTIIDSLNEKKIVEQLHDASNVKGSISKLERWFSELMLPNYQKQIKFLRELQELRSSGTGHRKGHNYEKAAMQFGLVGNNFLDVFDAILICAIDFLEFLTSIFWVSSELETAT